MLAAAVKFSAWQGSDGIITEGSSTTSNNDGVGFKGNFIILTYGITFLITLIKQSSSEAFMKHSFGIHRIPTFASSFTAMSTSK